MTIHKFLFLFLGLAAIGYSQNFVQSPLQAPTCYGSCDGSVVYTTTLSGGPFSAVLSNTSSCPNSTVQTANGNSLTISNLCPCASDYSVNFYNSSMALVGFELLQVPVTATSALVLQTPTVGPAACASCCNGTISFGWNGGFLPPPNDATVTLDGNTIPSTSPYSSVCVGQHTLCIKDMANCIVCTTFSMNFVISAGINSQSFTADVSVFPNPAENYIKIKTNLSESVTIEIIDVFGKILLTEKHSDNLTTVDITTIKCGVYFLHLVDKNGIIRGKTKIIKS
ncbi:MAG: T9SS type A sorting domain-containing protein [Bacteroidia bacterium]